MVKCFYNSPLRLALSGLVVLSAVCNFVNGVYVPLDDTEALNTTELAGGRRSIRRRAVASPTLNLLFENVKLYAGFPFEIENSTVEEKIHVPTCSLEHSESGCSLDEIKNAYNTVIYPGGKNTQCIDSSKPYFFQVFPGTGKDLLIYFAGGGGCWLNRTGELGSCYGGRVLASTRPQVVQEPYEGVFDKSNKKNPFKSYTIISISYCSGDLHGGNVNTVYDNIVEGGDPVHVNQAGSKNTMAALSWVMKNIPKPKKLVVMGCSAGALGAQLWGGYIAGAYKSRGHEVQTTVVADSYAGVFNGAQAYLLEHLNILDAPFMRVVPDCVMEQLKKGAYVCQVLDILHKIHQDVTYLSIQSKVDIVQYLFHIALANSVGGGGVNLNDPTVPECARQSIPDPKFTTFSPTAFNRAINGMYETFEPTPNFAPYLINSLFHCYTCFDRFFNTTINIGGNEENPEQVLLVDWVAQVTKRSWNPKNGIKGRCEIGQHYTNVNAFTLIQIGYTTCPDYVLE